MSDPAPRPESAVGGWADLAEGNPAGIWPVEEPVELADFLIEGVERPTGAPEVRRSELSGSEDFGVPVDLVTALATPDAFPPPARPVPTRRPWQRQYVAAVVAADAVAAVLASLAAAAVSDTLSLSRDLIFSPLFVVAWIFALAAGRTYETRSLGIGSTEYSRVLRSGVAVFALVGAADLLLGLRMGRPAVLAITSTVVLDLLARLVLRRRLYRARWRGQFTDRVIAVGSPDAVAHVVSTLRRDAHHGLQVVGACLTGPDVVDAGARSAALQLAIGVPVLGGVDDVPAAVAATASQVVTVAGTGDLSTGALRKLAWSLEPLGTEVLVSPGLVEVAGPRLTVRPYPSLPLLHVEQPRLSGPARALKGLADRVCAAVLLLLLSPVFAVVALLVRTTSAGPVFFRQTRIGLDGRPFQVWKFRSMVPGADDLIVDLDSQNEKDGALFKMRRDPRVTRVGSVLRRLSLDELPQLFNVLGGSMSLVGPRPPLPREVEQYGSDVRRRLLVRPGITGLWQVSGRSELTWEESVRLDLRYVENWTPGLDVSILWHTLSAVASGRGAY